MQKTLDLICLGRCSLDLYSNDPGLPFAALRTLSAYAGGCPTNICVAARRLGLKTAMLTGLGDDEVAGFILNFLKQEGVETRYITPKPGALTNIIVAALHPPDDIEAVAYHASNADLELNIDDVRAAPLDYARALLFTGMGLLRDPSRSATFHAVERTRAAGGSIFMDLDFRRSMWPDPRVYGVNARWVLPQVDVAIGTEKEVMGAADSDDLDAAIAQVRQLPRQALIVKRGERGSTVYTADGQVINAAPFPVDVVNFMGAGDAFAGAVVYGYLNGWNWARAARFANANGALIVNRHGTANAMPTLDEITHFMAQHTTA